jgi:hypothetical protein
LANYTAKGTPPGYDVKVAADYLQSFNAGWPLLKVDSTNNFSGTVTHNFGYPPFHILTSSLSPGSIDSFADEYGVDSSVLSRSSGAGSPRYYLFRLDLTTNFTAPIEQSVETVGAKNDGYVFKLSKPGKDVDSVDMRDFSLHSNTKSPMLHKVDHGSMTNTGGGLGWERTVVHGLDYVPTVFVFMKPNTNTLGLDPNKYGIVQPAVGVAGKYYEVSSTSVYVTADSFDFNGAAPEISVVVLKDPFNKQVINVSYP